MKFSKYNNPNKRRTHKRPAHSPAHMQEQKNEMYKLMAAAETEADKDLIIKAYNVSMF